MTRYSFAVRIHRKYNVAVALSSSHACQHWWNEVLKAARVTNFIGPSGYLVGDGARSRPPQWK